MCNLHIITQVLSFVGAPICKSIWAVLPLNLTSYLMRSSTTLAMKRIHLWRYVQALRNNISSYYEHWLPTNVYLPPHIRIAKYTKALLCCKACWKEKIHIIVWHNISLFEIVSWTWVLMHYHAQQYLHITLLHSIHLLRMTMIYLSAWLTLKMDLLCCFLRGMDIVLTHEILNGYQNYKYCHKLFSPVNHFPEFTEQDSSLFLTVSAPHHSVCMEKYIW